MTVPRAFCLDRSRLALIGLILVLGAAGLGWDEPPVGTVSLTLKNAVRGTEKKKPLYSVRFSPDGRLLASAGFERHACLRNVSDLSENKRLTGHIGDIFNVEFTPEGKKVLTSSRDGSLRVWNVDDGKEIVKFTEHQSPPRLAAISPDGRIAASGSVNALRLGESLIWDLQTGKVLRKLPYAAGVSQFRFSHDGKTLASASVDGTARLFDPNTGETKRILKGHTRGLTSLEFSRDDRRVITSSSDLTLRVFDASDGRELHNIKQRGGIVPGIACSPDGKLLAVTDVGELRIYAFPDMKPLLTLPLGKRILTNAAFSPDGKTLAISDNSGLIELYTVERRAE